MPRIARVVAPGLPHHITQRGNRKANIFFDREDRIAYLTFLKRYCFKHDLEILAYCLMPNHVHLVAIPQHELSLARALADTHMRYAQHLNWKYKQTGHVWQGRFFSCVLDEAHALAAARYVERNPVRAGLAPAPWDYMWSSARAHVGDAQDNLLSRRWPSGDLLQQWRDVLSAPDEGIQIESIRTSTRTGRPLGSGLFIEKVERTLGRLVRPKKAGRKAKPHPPLKIKSKKLTPEKHK